MCVCVCVSKFDLPHGRGASPYGVASFQGVCVCVCVCVCVPGETSGAHTTCCEKVAGPPASS